MELNKIKKQKLSKYKNKINSEKGITIVSLVLTIVVLGVLTAVTVNAGGSILKQVQLQNINTNMMLIQAKVKTISEQANFNKDTSIYKGNVVSDVSGNKNVQKLVEDGVIDDTSKYYVLWQEHLKDMGLEKIDVEDGYVVNYDTQEIIYVKGFEHDGTTYYKLSDMRILTID